MINASLGAHYSAIFVRLSVRLWWQTLFGLPLGQASEQLREQLEQLFGGTAVLVYKGRDAIELALRAYGLTKPTDQVLTQAFTCFAIEEAIVRAGATPVYVDVGEGELNLTVKTLDQALKRAKSARAVIVQNSLGHPADMAGIRRWCDRHKLLLIEDLAQSFGAIAGGQAVGTLGDAVVFSFGRDKVIDAVAGGAVVFSRRPSQFPSVSKLPRKSIILNDLAYPFRTWLIRATYDFGLGKLLHKLLTILKVLRNPTQSPTDYITAMPEGLAQLALLQLRVWPTIHKIRRVAAALYIRELVDTPVKILTTKEDLKYGALLRVAAKVSEPKKLLNYLKRQNIHLTDRWYRQPVDCGQLDCSTHYQAGSCPNAEKLAATIINLPTHAKLSIKDAQKIIAQIKIFYKK